MGIKVASHLKRNRFGVFYFRQVVPPQLRKFFAFKEFSRSTRTSRRGEAVALARNYAACLALLFERLRRMANDKDPDTLEFRHITRIEFHLDGTLKSIFADARPGEEEAVAALVPKLIQVAQTGQPRTPTISEDAPRLGAEMDKFINEHAGGGSWSGATVLDVRGDFDQVLAILGDVPVATIGHEEMNRLKDTLLALPANTNKMPETRGKTIDEVLALGLPPQSPNTVKKKWTRISAFFEWLAGKGLVDRNYAKGKKPKAKAQSYEKFTRDDLVRLFENDEYQTSSFKEAFQYWLPVLGLYTGGRLEELAQLHLADIRHDPDTSKWAVEITEEIDEEDGAETGKNLKTDASTRTVPLHPAVIAAGLPDYIANLRFMGYDRLFPELLPDAFGKISPRASEWFTEYRRSKEVGAMRGKSTKTFHSFRHTMNTTLQKAGVALEVREAICGHTSKAINNRVYGGTFTIVQLREAIEKLNFDIELPAFTARPEHERARQKAKGKISAA